MQIPRKKILFVNRSIDTLRAQESLDALLMASTFNQEISVLFIDEGVLQLKADQLQNNFTKTFKGLSLYGIEKIYIDATSLKKHHLTQNELIIPTASLNTQEVGTLLQAQDAILNF